MFLETVLLIVVGISCFIMGRITAPSEEYDEGYEEGWNSAFDILGDKRED